MANKLEPPNGLVSPLRAVILAVAALGLLYGLYGGVSAPPARAASQDEISATDFMALNDPKPVPVTAFDTGDGNSVTFQDFRGRVLLVNFWSTACGPCRAEMPGLDHLQTVLGGKDFEVLALSVDQFDFPLLQSFLDDIGVKNLAVYRDSGLKVASALRLYGLPTTVLIDRDGNEVGRALGPRDWDSPTAIALIRRFIDGKGAP